METTYMIRSLKNNKYWNEHYHMFKLYDIGDEFDGERLAINKALEYDLHYIEIIKIYK